jgi:hypothetical protein
MLALAMKNGCIFLGSGCLHQASAAAFSFLIVLGISSFLAQAWWAGWRNTSFRAHGLFAGLEERFLLDAQRSSVNIPWLPLAAPRLG